MQPGKEDFFETLLKVHGIKFVSSYRNAKMKLKTYHQTVTDILLYSQCRQLNHYLPSKYHWWWLHLLLASNKFDSEYTLLSRSINFSSCGKDCEAFMSSYSRTAFSLRDFLRTFISPIFYKKASCVTSCNCTYLGKLCCGSISEIFYNFLNTDKLIMINVHNTFLIFLNNILNKHHQNKKIHHYLSNKSLFFSFTLIHENSFIGFFMFAVNNLCHASWNFKFFIFAVN